MTYKKFDLVFGFFVIGVFLWFFFMLFSGIFGGSMKSYKLRAAFSSAEGITAGSEVKIAGVKVGEVTGIVVNPKTYKADVAMKIESRYELATDTIASIESSGLLGGKFINIQPGGMEDILGNNAVIEYTQSSLNLEKLVSRFASSGGGDSDKK